MNSPPRKISERGMFRPVWQEFNRLIDYVREIAVVGGRNVEITRTINGTLIVPQAVKSGGDSTIRQYRIKSIQNDFYTCRTWNGSEEGTTDISIARPFEHRVSNFNGQSVAYSSDGDVFTATYSYTSATKRTKTVSGVAETQVLVPYFKTDFHLIYAVNVSAPLTAGPSNTPITDTNDNPITLLDLNVDGRAWAKLEATTGNN
jgi:hypothetical protein